MTLCIVRAGWFADVGRSVASGAVFARAGFRDRSEGGGWIGDSWVSMLVATSWVEIAVVTL